MTEIRVTKIRATQIRATEIRTSSNHRELHGAIFVWVSVWKDEYHPTQHQLWKKEWSQRWCPPLPLSLSHFWLSTIAQNLPCLPESLWLFQRKQQQGDPFFTSPVETWVQVWEKQPQNWKHLSSHHQDWLCTVGHSHQFYMTIAFVVFPKWVFLWSTLGEQPSSAQCVKTNHCRQ